MKAIVYSRYGGPEVLEVREVPEPKLGPESVLIDVKTVSVNPVDWQTAAGHLDSRFDVHFPVIPGWDVAGVVARVGPTVTEFTAGDEVIGYVREDSIGRGTYAERVAAPLRTIARKPAGLSWEQAAAVPIAGLTAYQSLVHALRTGPGDTVLIQAAAGGVGSFAVQIGVALGARVIGTASAPNHDYLRRLGAEPVAYGPGLDERVRALAPHGVTAILDMYGGEALTASLGLLNDASKGRVVSLTNDGVLENGGTFVFARPSATDLQQLSRMVESGVLVPEVSTVMDLTDAAEAFRLSQTGHVRGKIILRVAD
ncbi:NADPH:quinone reductase [Thermomonospora echinospora]|uniref:NADPH:quinone reductase n=1 Tax=Thermomonospora echinospora TaxID=1992 RepID=A0A1H6DZ01_9ACTN|nr:NADP-dependent oxidoreductase [Thermomonospora echinospora]SEG90568.1 NADPH:quinone reductase [Thermomonospora echinospora]